jgi:hypothetical protein
MTEIVVGLIQNHLQDEPAINFADSVDKKAVEKLVASVEAKQADRKMVKQGGSK